MVPAIFLAVAALLLNIVLSRLVSLQRQQIAVLKALGYADRRIGLHYLRLVAVMCVGRCRGGRRARGLAGRRDDRAVRQYFRFPDLAYRLDVGVASRVAVTAIAGAWPARCWRCAR